MFYREAGQYKTTYASDAAIFPIRQDRVAIAIVLAVAFVVVPLTASPYVFSAILIPFLILSLAALGLNILALPTQQVALMQQDLSNQGVIRTQRDLRRIKRFGKCL